MTSELRHYAEMPDHELLADAVTAWSMDPAQLAMLAQALAARLNSRIDEDLRNRSAFGQPMQYAGDRWE